MKKKKSRQSIKSLKNLNCLLKDADLPQIVADEKGVKKPPSLIMKDGTDEKKLFLDAMTDVKPMFRKNIIEKTGIRKRRTLRVKSNPDQESLDELTRLVCEGKGFDVSSTPEYVEGANYNVHPEIAKRLHKGQFSIQAHLDLHGFTAAGAEAAFNAFLKQCVLTQKRCILIVHGRGLSSPDKPILKTKMYEWLTCGPWRKWVIAFSSARACDGGTGATYVLLRKSPLTKRMRKRNLSSVEDENRPKSI